MKVYVDPPFNRLRQGRASFAGWYEGCHLFAESRAQLVEFARGVGLPASWIHEPAGKLAHFELAPNQRARAIARGAICLTRQAADAKIHELLARSPT